MDESLIKRISRPTGSGHISMREYHIVDYLEKNGGRATRNELKEYLFKRSGFVSFQKAIRNLHGINVISRPRPGVYELASKPLGQKQNP